VRRRYLGRLSGPLLDRIDLQVTLLPVATSALLSDRPGAEPSDVVAKRVVQARAAAADRWVTVAVERNADVTGAVLRDRRWRLPRAVTTTLAKALDQGQLSARGYDRVIKVAWTIADLDGRARPDAGDLTEALQLRKGNVI
jgi:magnesium chelatase family protein